MQTMNNYYTEKRALYLSQCVSGKKPFTEWFHPVIMNEIMAFPFMERTIPITFNHSYAFNPEEQCKIQLMVTDAYTRNKRFKEIVDELDWKTDSVGIVKGFHETDFIKESTGKTSVHFNVQIFSKTRRDHRTYHFVTDRFKLQIFKITFTDELEF